MAYDNDTLKQVKQTWESFKASTRTSQAKAAKAMGMNQSSLSQYLRGEIPLNTDFLTKFSVLTNTKLVEVASKDSTTSRPIKVRFTLSGRVLKDTIALIPSPISLEKSYAILVDYADFVMPQGTLILVGTDATVKEHDQVMYLRNGERPIFGTLGFVENEWEVLEPHFHGGRRFVVNVGDEIHRIGGTFLPEQQGRTFKE